MEQKRTYLDAFELRIVGLPYIDKQGDEKDKIAAGLIKLMKQVNDHIDEYNNCIDDFQLDNCSTYPDGPKKGSIIYEEGTDEKGRKTRNRVFTPEAEKIVKKAGKDLLKKEIIFHSRIIENIDPELIKKLTDRERECFAGLVIPAADETPSAQA